MLVLPGMILPGMTAVFVDNVLIRQYDGWLGSAARRARRGVPAEHRPALAAGTRPAAHRAAAGPGAVGALRVACPQLARRFFGQRYTRRPGEPRRSQRPGGHAACPRFRQRGGKLPDGGFPGRRHDLLRRDPGGDRPRQRGPQHPLVAGCSGAPCRTWRSACRPSRASSSRHRSIGLQSIETLKATAGENDFFSKWAGLPRTRHQLGAEARDVPACHDLLPSMLLGLTSAAILGVGALEIIDRDPEHRNAGRLPGPADEFLRAHPADRRRGQQGPAASADLSRLDDVLELPERLAVSRGQPRRPSKRAPPVICRCSDVSFGYSALEPPLIEDSRSTSTPGRWVALVGKSGSGKSTLGKLITGLFEPHAGKILIDGYTLPAWGRERLSKIVASSTRTSGCSAAPSTTISPCGTTPSTIDAWLPPSTMRA